MVILTAQNSLTLLPTMWQQKGTNLEETLKKQQFREANVLRVDAI